MQTISRHRTRLAKGVGFLHATQPRRVARRQTRPTCPAQYRKLHLAVDAESGQIVAVTLADQNVGDSSQVGPLLKQTPNEIGQVTGDGADDGEPTYALVAERSADIAAVIPPRASSTVPPDLGLEASCRDVHVHTVAALGRLGWLELSVYRAARTDRDHDGSQQVASRPAAVRA